MSERPFTYVCSPFRGATEANAERARGYCRQVFKAGYAPLAPHLYFPQFLNEENPDEREAGMSMGVALLPLCRAIVVCGDKLTEGMKLEIAAARRLDIPVYSLDIFLQEVSEEQSAKKPSVLKQIAEAREHGAPASKPKQDGRRKSRGEEL